MRRTLLTLMLPLMAIPPGWPHHLALGVSDSPGDAQALRAHARVDMRYQYLAGGVNTGHGWASWNPGGSFVSMYVRESLAAAAGGRLVIIHVEPYLWGHLEQAHAVRLARAFAQRLIALRNRFAPHVLLAWHLSVWGTKEDPTYPKPPLQHMDQLAAQCAAFYESLHAHCDLVFNDVTDRDADFYKDVDGNPHTWWGPADFVR